MSSPNELKLSRLVNFFGELKLSRLVNFFGELKLSRLVILLIFRSNFPTAIRIPKTYLCEGYIRALCRRMEAHGRPFTPVIREGGRTEISRCVGRSTYFGSPPPTPVLCEFTGTGRCDTIGGSSREGGPSSRRRADSLRRADPLSRVVQEDGRMRYQGRVQYRGRSELSLPRTDATGRADALSRAHARRSATSVRPRIVPP